jgi:periplasmic copper chaperone A
VSGTRAFARIVGAALAATFALTAHAGEVTRAGSLEIDTPWARASVGTARPSAAYVTIRNTGDRPERLIEVTTSVAGHAETHAMVHEDGVIKMRPAGPVEIPAGGEVQLAPGGLHIMLMHLNAPLEEGGTLPLTLVFETAGEVTVEAQIASIGADAPPQ